MAHNVQRIPAAGGLYGAGYVPIANYAANTAALAALQKNAAVAAAAYGGYTGYAMPQAFPATAFQLPIHDVYQTYWLCQSIFIPRGEACYVGMSLELINEKNVFWCRFLESRQGKMTVCVCVPLTIVL